MPMHTSAPYSVGALYLDFGPHRPLYIAEIGDQDLPARDVVKSYFDSNSSVEEPTLVQISSSSSRIQIFKCGTAAIDLQMVRLRAPQSISCIQYMCTQLNYTVDVV